MQAQHVKHFWLQIWSFLLHAAKRAANSECRNAANENNEQVRRVFETFYVELIVSLPSTQRMEVCTPSRLSQASWTWSGAEHYAEGVVRPGGCAAWPLRFRGQAIEKPKPEWVLQNMVRTEIFGGGTDYSAAWSVKKRLKTKSAHLTWSANETFDSLKYDIRAQYLQHMDDGSSWGSRSGRRIADQEKKC